MPFLTCHDDLPARPRRILLNGTSASGKTTLARRIGRVLDVPHVEIDALFHGPDWVPRPEFETDVRSFADRDAWVTEWQYGSVREHLLARADLVVWLDVPVPIVMAQVVRRTLVRRLGRQELWNGNIEPPLHTILHDPEHIVRWAWTTRRRAGERSHEVLRDRPDLPVVRLRSRRQARAWVEGPLTAAAAAPSPG